MTRQWTLAVPEKRRSKSQQPVPTTVRCVVQDQVTPVLNNK